MAYDEKLAARVRKALAPQKGVDEIPMMGGLCFRWRGHMACGVLGDGLVVRVGPDGYEDALAQAHAGPMTLTGRPLRGIVVVAPTGLHGPALASWVRRGVDFVATLPPKRAGAAAPRRRAPARSRRTGPGSA